MKIDLIITKNETKEHLKIELPSSWDQIKFKDYVSLLGCTDTIKIVALFTGLDEELIRKAQINNLSGVTICLNFLNKPPEYTLPSHILGYPIAKNLDTKSIAQYSDLQDILKEFKSEDSAFNYSLFPLIVATYAVVSDYDYAKAELIKDAFLEAPCTEVLAVANFTLVKFNALRNGIDPTFPQADTIQTRWRQALRDWLQTLDSSIRFYLWKRSLPLSERNFLNGL